MQGGIVYLLSGLLHEYPEEGRALQEETKAEGWMMALSTNRHAVRQR